MNKIINATLLFLTPFFMSWTQRSKTVYVHKRPISLKYCSQICLNLTAAATIGFHNQRMSAQTVRNHLREAHLHACRPHRCLDLTAVCHRNRLEWANAHIRWHLALWRGVFFMDASQFSLYRADGRQRVWRSVCMSMLWIGLQQLIDKNRLLSIMKIIDNDSHYLIVRSALSARPTSAGCIKLQHWIMHFYRQNASKNAKGNRMRCCGRTRLRDPSCQKHENSLF